MIGRRSFLRLLGVAPVAAPVAAKAAAGELMAASSVTGIGVLPSMTAASADYFGSSPAETGDYEKNEMKALKAIIKGAWPVHVEDRIRRNAQDVRCLDPDLASNRSMSLSTKVRLQRERNYVRMKAECIDDARVRLAKKALPEWARHLW